MYIAIDDTYGPTNGPSSKYVTGARKTWVAVEFDDHEVAEIRSGIKNTLTAIKTQFNILVQEFHFTDIYNRISPWNQLPDRENLKIIEAFADLYYRNNWVVHIQTIDERTLKDHGIESIIAKPEGLNLKNRDELALFFMLSKIKSRIGKSQNINLIIDEGLKKNNHQIGNLLFHGYHFHGSFQSSSNDPLLQIADFLAFAINRCTHLMLKENRSETDLWFLDLIASMEINSTDINYFSINENSSSDDLDIALKKHRCELGLE